MCIAGLLDAMRSSLPTAARIVWQCLENHADHNRRWAMSLERIVAEVNLSIETVVRSVRILEAHGIVRGQRDGPGRRATVWHMLRSYNPSPHNGGIEPEETPQDTGINGKETPQHAGIKQPETPQSDGIKNQGYRQSAGIETRQSAGFSRFPPQTPPFLTHQENPPEDPPRSPPVSRGGRTPRPTKIRNGFRALPSGPTGPVIDATAEELADFQTFRGNLRLVGATNG